MLDRNLKETYTDLPVHQLSVLANQLRRDVLRMVHQCQSGHPGAALGCADLMAALYFHVMNHSSDFSIDGDGEDLFFLSNGHLSALWYSALARSGYFCTSELQTFRKIDSRLQGHPTPHDGLPGVRIASGSLGQGLSVAIGACLTKKRKGDTATVYCLMGDGEIQEGQVWEAALYAAHNKIYNLVGIIDVNGQQLDGSTPEILCLGDLQAKWRSFGWAVVELEGNNMEACLQGLQHANVLTGKGKPVMILMHTVMGKGVDFMEGTHKWHGQAPNDAQLKLALDQIYSPYEDFS